MSDNFDNLFDTIDEDTDDFEDIPDDDIDDEDLRRMQEAEAAFEQQVKQRMRDVRAHKADVESRIEAAYWLGESGDPQAITSLRKVYLETKDDKLKTATAYALGQFKALDQAIVREPGEPVINALGNEENEDIIKLLTAIRIEGKFGQRSRLPTRLLTLLNGLLVISLIVVGALVLMNQNTATAEITPDDRLADTFATFNAPQYISVDAGARGTVDQLRSDGAVARGVLVWLSAEFDALAAAEPPDCDTPITLPEQIEVESAIGQTYFAIGDAASHYNRAIGNLNTPQNIHDSYCGDVPTEPQPAEIDRANESLAAASSALDLFEGSIGEALAQVMVTVTPPPAFTEAPPTPEGPPTPTPIPTLDPIVERTYIQDLLSVIRDVNGDDGANTLLLQYWNDISSSGRTQGCDLQSPLVPAPREIPETVTNSGATQLISGWSQVNVALTALQDGWNLFNDTCQQGTISDLALSVGIQSAQTADQLIREANTILLSER